MSRSQPAPSRPPAAGRRRPAATAAALALAALTLVAVSAPPAAAQGDDCIPGEHTLCLHDRFMLTVDWRNQHGGGVEGRGHAMPLTPKTGAFWFFDAGNYEVTAKVLDGRTINGHFWVFLGSLSDVEYWVTVDDLVSGRREVYYNPPGNRYGIADTDAFDSGAVCATIAGLQCPEGEICDLDPGTCLFADQAGTCVPEPAACIPVVDPVCGCDGMTYGNDCERLMAGVSLDHAGACSGDEGAICGGILGRGCAAGLFCDLEAGTCGAADQTGLCALRPDPAVCDMVLAPAAPVCGCDGVTYGSECHRAAAGVSKAHDGPCAG